MLIFARAPVLGADLISRPILQALPRNRGGPDGTGRPRVGRHAEGPGSS